MRILHRVWSKPVLDFLQKVYDKQGKTSGSCTGMNSMIVVGLTQMPVFFDAAQDELYSVCPEKANFYNGGK